MIMTRKTFSRAAQYTLGFAAALMVTGCVSLLPGATEAPAIYRLTPPPVSVSPIAGAPSVRVAVPVATKALQGSDIVVAPDGNRLAAAAGARWAESVPKLLQQAILQSLGQRAGLTAIAPPTSASADYALETRVRAFEAAFDQGKDSAPLIKVQISATVTDLKTRQIVSRKEFYTQQRAAQRRVTTIVQTLDKATQSVMTDMSDWLETQVAGAQSAN